MGHMKDFHIRIRNGGDDAINAVSELITYWIPVIERLPEHGSVVLAYYSKGSTRTAVYANDGLPSGPWSCEGDEDIDFGNVTHWMPLPPPPAP